MSASAGQLGGSSAAAQRAARSILAEGRFHQPSVPHPLHGVLVALGKIVSAPFSGVGSLVNSIGHHFPGGVGLLWVVLALAVLALVLAVARRQVRSRLNAPADGSLGAREQRASELERAAEAAAAAGKLEQAVRLRFRAGLTRLSERETIPAARTTLTGEVARTLASERFDALAARFDEIAYGDSPATGDDVARQRDDWPKILERAARR